MELAVGRRVLRFRAPLRTAYATLSERELLSVELRAADGQVGRGEAAPLEPYDGVPLAAVADALADCAPAIAASDGAAAEHEDLLAACRDRAVLPQAVAAVDLALWDLAGRRAARPVAALLAAEPAPRVPVSATIAATDRAGAAAQAAAAVAAGFGCLKAKIAVGDDAGRLAAIRAAVGPGVALRVDANGAWSPGEAHAALRALAPVGLALCEDPVADLDALAETGDFPVPVAIDQSAPGGGPLPAGAAAFVCLKVARCGGISGALAAAARARAAGAEVYLTSTYDGPVGIAAALHAAAALAPLPPCGLATLGLFADVEDPFPVRDGEIAVPTGPGLGVG